MNDFIYFEDSWNMKKKFKITTKSGHQYFWSGEETSLESHLQLNKLSMDNVEEVEL